jgi:hypothetical protein
MEITAPDPCAIASPADAHDELKRWTNAETIIVQRQIPPKPETLTEPHQVKIL